MLSYGPKNMANNYHFKGYQISDSSQKITYKFILQNNESIKFMKLGKRHIGVIAAIAVGIAVLAVIQDSQSSDVVLVKNPEIKIHTTDEDLTSNEKKAIDLVQNYNGVDSQGDNLAYVIGNVISSKYSEDVIYSPNTKLGWGAFSDPDQENLYGVTFEFVSDNDEFSFLWYVNINTNEIYAASDGAEQLLILVDSS